MFCVLIVILARPRNVNLDFDTVLFSSNNISNYVLFCKTHYTYKIVVLILRIRIFTIKYQELCSKYLGKKQLSNLYSEIIVILTSITGSYSYISINLLTLPTHKVSIERFNLMKLASVLYIFLCIILYIFMYMLRYHMIHKPLPLCQYTAKCSHIIYMYRYTVTLCLYQCKYFKLMLIQVCTCMNFRIIVSNKYNDNANKLFSLGYILLTRNIMNMIRIELFVGYIFCNSKLENSVSNMGQLESMFFTHINYKLIFTIIYHFEINKCTYLLLGNANNIVYYILYLFTFRNHICKYARKLYLCVSQCLICMCYITHLFGYSAKYYFRNKIKSEKPTVAVLYFGLESNSRWALDETCWRLRNTQVVMHTEILFLIVLYVYFNNNSSKKRFEIFKIYYILSYFRNRTIYNKDQRFNLEINVPISNIPSCKKMLLWRKRFKIRSIFLCDWNTKCKDHIGILIEHGASFIIVLKSSKSQDSILLLLESYNIYIFITLYFYVLSHYIMSLGGGIMFLYVQVHSIVCSRGHAMKGRGEYYDLALVII